MSKEWQTFVRKYEDMTEGEMELFIKDLSPGPTKYDTRHVKAEVSRSEGALPDSDILWIRSESGLKTTAPWRIRIVEDLPEWTNGRPWENVLGAIQRPKK